jgi:CRISPR-associated protein Csd1
MLAELAAYARDHLEGPESVPYYARRPVKWELIIDDAGVPESNQLEPRFTKEVPFGTVVNVPSVTRTSGIAPAIGVDSIEYVLGRDADNEEQGCDSDRAAARLQAFIDLNEAWAKADPEGPGAAIAAFYRDGHHRRTELPAPRTDPKTGETKSEWRRSDLVQFIVATADSDRVAHDCPSAHDFWAGAAIGRKGLGARGICLVCGTEGELLKTLPQQLPKHLVPGATQSPALSSVNKATHGFNLATDLRHTPICAICGRRATTALQYLLSDADHAVHLDNARMIWWSRGGTVPLGAVQHPDEHLDAIVGLVASARKGSPAAPKAAAEAAERFYSARIAGNVARVVVRDWVDMSLEQVRRNLGLWFDQIRINRAGQYLPGVGVLALACGRRVKDGKTTKYADFKDRAADRPDSVLGDLYRTAVLGAPLPRSLAAHLVQRASRDQYFDVFRAVLLRHWFNKGHRHDYQGDRIPMGLDSERTDPAYLAGRLFALYESMQYRANNPKAAAAKPGAADANTETAVKTEVNSTFHDRYFSGAIKNPAIGWVAGAELSAAWLKLIRGRSPGLAGWYAKSVNDIVERIDTMPTASSLEDKVLFLMGYSHQHNAPRGTADNPEADNEPQETRA